MSGINDGGPAFPVVFEHSDGQCISEQHGMSLRDYFAAKAMQGELAAQAGHMQISTDSDVNWLAENSYRIADAMLRAREAK